MHGLRRRLFVLNRHRHAEIMSSEYEQVTVEAGRVASDPVAMTTEYEFVSSEYEEVSNEHDAVTVGDVAVSPEYDAVTNEHERRVSGGARP